MNTFDLYLKKILNAPLWIKQVIYLKLTKEMRENLCEEDLKNFSDNILSTFVPILTFKGKTELTDKKCGLDNNIYSFLKYCEKGYSMLEISVNTFLSMEETSKYLQFCIEQEFVKTPDVKLYALLGFIAGKLRVGEYLEKTGIITSEQLETALEKQHDNEKLGETLISLGFITQKDLKALCILKEEAKKRFILDYNSIPDTKTVFSSDNAKYENEINKLKEENLKLKQKMSSLLRLVKNNE